MNSRHVELALKKQRLQMRSAVLREDFAAYAAGLRPGLALADRGRSALRWLRRHPLLPVAAMAALLVSHPRAALRWVRRGFIAWQTLSKLRGALQPNLPRNR